MIMSAKWQKYFFRIMLVLCALILCEIALHVFGYKPHEQFQNFICGDRVMRPIPGVPYLVKPYASFTERWPDNSDGYFDAPSNSISYHVNNCGFRGPDMSLERNERPRVAFLGDSFCWGLGVRDEDNFIEVMSKQIGATLGREVELYNFGMPGFDTVHEVALASYVIPGFRPDICVMWFFLNDIGGGSGLMTMDYLGGDDLWLSLRRRFFLFDLAATPLSRIAGERKLIANYTKVYADGSQKLERMSRLLGVFADLCKANNIKPVLVVHPILYKLDGDYPFLKVHEKVLAIAAEKGIMTVDLFPYFKGMKADELWVHPLDQHPNRKAHKIAADGFGEYLVRIISGLEKEKNE